jgi:hypothetical protein
VTELVPNLTEIQSERERVFMCLIETERERKRESVYVRASGSERECFCV